VKIINKSSYVLNYRVAPSSGTPASEGNIKAGDTTELDLKKVDPGYSFVLRGAWLPDNSTITFVATVGDAASESE
jgi:hypothetical protein